MKIKNLAFFGIMAAILGVNGAARADSTTIIASQAYVDAKDALKQDKDNRIQTSQADYEAISGLTDTKRKEDYPSMYTLKQAIASASSDASNMKDTAASATWANNTLSIVTTENAAGNKTDKVATSNQVQTSISALKSYTDHTKQAKSTANYSMGKSDGTWEAMSQTQQDALNSGIDSTKVAQIATNTSNISTNTSNISSNSTAIQNLEKAIEMGLKEKNPTLYTAYQAWVTPAANGGGGRSYSSEQWTALKALLTTENLQDVDNVIADAQKDHQELIPRNRNIQKGVLYMEGSGIENMTESADPSAAKSWSKYAGRDENITNLKEAKAMDKYVPTMAAVESRVLAAIETAVNDAGSNVNSADTNALDSAWDTHTGYLTQVASVRGMVETNGNNGTGLATNSNGTVTIGNGSDTKVPSTKYVAETFKALTGKNADGATGVSAGAAADTNKEGQAVVAVSQTNGQVTATLGTVGSKGITDGAVTTAKIDSKAVTAAKIADDTITASQIASNAVDTAEIKNGAVTNAKISANSLAYKDTMDPKLSNVNATGDAGTAMTNCTLKSPCTLTMIWDGTNSKPIYEWTNMDTEDTSATI